jgi:hypothetical protein
MSLTLNNRKDIVADSISTIKGNKTVDLIESLDAVQGLVPETLNSLEKLATALSIDNNFFASVTTALGNKAEVSTTYTRSVVNGLLDAKVDDTEMVNYATQANTFTKAEVNGLLNSKPSDEELTTAVSSLTTSIKTKSPIRTTYTKTEVDNKVSALVGSATALLDTLQQISLAFNNDPSFSYTILNSTLIKHH